MALEALEALEALGEHGVDPAVGASIAVGDFHVVVPVDGGAEVVAGVAVEAVVFAPEVLGLGMNADDGFEVKKRAPIDP